MPPDLEIKKVSFYWSGGSVNNITRGTRGDYEVAAFDYDPNTETANPFTVIAVKTMSPTAPTTHLSRASAIQLERVGEWVIAFEPGRDIRPEQIGQLADDVLKLLEYAKGLPPNA